MRLMLSLTGVVWTLSCCPASQRIYYPFQCICHQALIYQNLYFIIQHSNMNNLNNLSRKPSQPNPPGSGKFSKKQFDIKDINGIPLSRENVHYVLGISGGDCAGKKQLINYMFLAEDGQWCIKDSKQKQKVTVIHQDFFLRDKDNKFNSRGIDWKEFEKAILTLFAGNQHKITNAKLKGIEMVLKPNKLLILEGNHVFMQDLPIQKYMDCKVFIDSDSDVRLSRRIYKDTQDDKVPLNESIDNYLRNIKPSYEKQIEPCKITSDIIIPHFGGGYNDHRKKDKQQFESNIHNVKGFIIARIREEMEKDIHQQQNILKQ